MIKCTLDGSVESICSASSSLGLSLRLALEVLDKSAIISLESNPVLRASVEVETV